MMVAFTTYRDGRAGRFVNLANRPGGYRASAPGSHPTNPLSPRHAQLLPVRGGHHPLTARRMTRHSPEGSANGRRQRRDR